MRRVSSAATRDTAPSVSRARAVMSPRFPIGRGHDVQAPPAPGPRLPRRQRRAGLLRRLRASTGSLRRHRRTQGPAGPLWPVPSASPGAGAVQRTRTATPIRHGQGAPGLAPGERPEGRDVLPQGLGQEAQRPVADEVGHGHGARAQPARPQPQQESPTAADRPGTRRSGWGSGRPRGRWRLAGAAPASRSRGAAPPRWRSRRPGTPGARSPAPGPAPRRRRPARPRAGGAGRRRAHQATAAPTVTAPSRESPPSQREKTVSGLAAYSPQFATA